MKTIGRYQITRELGRGAMGVVYHAIDPVIGRAVAIKTLRLSEVDDGEQRQRLRDRLFREARSAGALSHPGIVTIYDMDEVDGLAYIAMEFVDGETLEDILGRSQAISRERLTEILRQAAAALDYAHRKGIIHRDIKPANIMIDGNGAVKITDFGIAKITQIEGQTLTGVLVGTPNYMSPEQVQGHEIDGRSDQFSLAVIAYEMLAGERPFYGEQISTVVYKIVADQPPPVQNVNGSLNDMVDRALRRGLAKKQERRFASCTAFVTALDGALQNTKNWRVVPRKAFQSLPTAVAEAATKTVRAPRAESANNAKKSAGKPVVAGAGSVAPQPRKRGGWLMPFLGAFLFLLAVLAVVAWQTGLIDVDSLLEIAHAGPDASPPETEPATPPKTQEQPAPVTTPDAKVERPSPMPAGYDQPASATPASSAPQPPAQATQPSLAQTPAQIPTQAAPDRPVVFHQVRILSDPAEAVASLDNRSDSTCRTPCTLNASVGVHNLTLKLDGYQPELREVRVDRGNQEVPLITLRSTNGMLMLTSDPEGASVSIDGKPTYQFTPLRITLPPGPHEVSIEKNGLRTSDTVDIESGGIRNEKLIAKRK